MDIIHSVTSVIDLFFDDFFRVSGCTFSTLSSLNKLYLLALIALTVPAPSASMETVLARVQWVQSVEYDGSVVRQTFL